jgi:hypothetical protein
MSDSQSGTDFGRQFTVNADLGCDLFWGSLLSRKEPTPMATSGLRFSQIGRRYVVGLLLYLCALGLMQRLLSFFVAHFIKDRKEKLA